ncbi:ATPase [Halobacteriales archaeon SW_5_70_135]|nr:MAG: ATPase [Halobacteriales archaeon SW_5_70_135]
MSRVLVAGADRVDAGKTTLSTALCHRLDAPGRKPRAGNDYWFDHGDYRRAVGDGRLYGTDARRLAAASPDDPTPEDCNPVHRLWRPDPGGGRGLVGREGRQFVLDRVAGSYVVNARASVPETAREHLPTADAVRVDSVAELNAVTRRRHLPALAAAAREVRGLDRVVVESYGDVARPLQGVATDGATAPGGERASDAVDGPPTDLYDRVAVVEPGRLCVYDGPRWMRACEAVGGGDSRRTGRLESRVGDVLSHVDPRSTVDLPALDGETRVDPDRVAAAYEPALDAVVGTTG